MSDLVGNSEVLFSHVTAHITVQVLFMNTVQALFMNVFVVVANVHEQKMI